MYARIWSSRAGLYCEAAGRAWSKTACAKHFRNDADTAESPARAAKKRVASCATGDLTVPVSHRHQILESLQRLGTWKKARTD
jgi:hypothetical protein